MKQIIIDNIPTNYYITEEGKCYNFKTNKWLKGQISNSGYLNYNISITPNYKKRLYAHRLVAEYYIPNLENKKEVNHKDGNKLNNCKNNLEWVTRQENAQYNRIIHKNNGRTVYCFNGKRQLVDTINSITEASEKYNVSIAVLRLELNSINKKLTKGYYWSYYDNNNFAIEKIENYRKIKKIAQYSKNGELIAIFNSQKEAANSVGSNKGTHIGECCRGKIKFFKNFIWKYYDDIV